MPNGPVVSGLREVRCVLPKVTGARHPRVEANVPLAPDLDRGRGASAVEEPPLVRIAAVLARAPFELHAVPLPQVDVLHTLRGDEF